MATSVLRSTDCSVAPTTAFDAVPAELRNVPRWLNYRLEDDPKHPHKPRKVPMQARVIGRKASSTDPTTWAGFQDAVRALADPASGYAGLGFALGDGWIGIDCDHCVDCESGDIDLWANDVIERFDSYAEFSPSGTGVHILVRGELPPGWRKWGNVEMYSGQRYFTVTGRRVENTPNAVCERSSQLAKMHAEFSAQRAAEAAVRRGAATLRAPAASTGTPSLRLELADDDVLRRANASRSGTRFARLWSGDWTGYPSQSEADLALAGDLAFWCDGDGDHVDRLFRQSGLMREKWDQQRGELTYGQATVARVLESWRSRPPRRVGSALVRPAPTTGHAQVEAAETRDGGARHEHEPAETELLPPEFSEDAIALEFTRRYRETHRYTAEFSRWSQWDGTRWARDSTLEVFNRVRLISREIASGVDNPRLASLLVRANTVAAVERLCRGDRAHAATAEQWDASDWLLNTPGGVIELPTGDLRAARPDDYLTHRTAVAPAGDAPAWTTFLQRVTGGDDEIQGFLRRMAGYCLTGDIRAHALFFLYGTGGNGKGTFLNTITAILGDYATVAPIETFTASKNDRHPTELAGLKGARLVASQETEEGRHWAEAKIKAMTGGDPISARFMRGDFFTFRPTFKLVIAGNHRPRLKTVDEAMRRRLHLIPFTQTIPASERDESLPERLRAEWPGILAWAIQGCLEWQRDGLKPPASICAATDDYFAVEDSVQAWMDDCCLVGSMAWGRAGDLFTSWRGWAEERGEVAGSAKAFAEKLKHHGLEPKKTAGERGYAGIALKVPVDRGEWRHA